MPFLKLVVGACTTERSASTSTSCTTPVFAAIFVAWWVDYLTMCSAVDSATKAMVPLDGIISQVTDT